MLITMTQGPDAAGSPLTSVAWGVHDDPAGFTLEVPAGWQVSAATPGEIAVSDPQGSAAALVRVRRVPSRSELAPWLARNYAATEPGLHNVRMLRVEGYGPRVARAAFEYGSSVFQGRASAVAARDGEVATIFIAAAARERFAQALPTLARILDSVRFAPTRAAESGATLRHAPWVDPLEGTFLATVPEGWRTEGGLRYAATSPHLALAVTSTSGDATMQVFFGDAQLPRRFIVPGDRGGAVVGANDVFPETEGDAVLPYRRAEVHGAELAERRFGARVRAVHPRSDLAGLAWQPESVRPAIRSASAADVDFRLADGRAGRLTLVTSGVDVNRPGAIWRVECLFGFVAPPERLAVAATASLTLVASLRENPRRATPFNAEAELELQDYLARLREVQQCTLTARLLADESCAETFAGEVPDWRALTGLDLAGLLAIAGTGAGD